MSGIKTPIEHRGKTFSEAGLSPLKRPLASVVNCAVKRLFDITISLIALIGILSWLVPIMSIIIKLTSKGPVFFSQKRTGKDNQSFDMLKFRSMEVNNDSDTIAAAHNDPRITAVGQFMRLTHIDEFPQFLLTLTGKMSIIGPRPHMLKHTEEYSEGIDDFMVRHEVKPGISGWAQVEGWRGSIMSKNEIEKRIEADIWYVENWSLWLDVKICFKTFILILKAVSKHR
jgi:putative colanic acid biosynthesis UDP-glucose lipid carrier transferase